MINVLYVVNHGDMGGAHRFLDSIFFNHSENVKPVVLSFREGPWLDELRRRNLTVYCVDQARLREPLRSFREVKSILEREHIDIVHSSYAWCHAMVTPAARWRGCRTMWFHHGPVGDGWWDDALSLIPADLVLTNSEFMSSRLKKMINGAKRMGVVHYGIDAKGLAPNAALRERFRRKWGLDESITAIGIVAFLDTWKGQDVFLQAAKLLSERRNKIRMFVIGGPRDGAVQARCVAFERELRRYAAENQLEDFVHFTGHVDVKEGALDGLDLFVHATTEPEPLGASILEAMAKGKAIIASGEGGVLEITEGNEELLLIEPRDPAVLAGTISRLIDAPEQRGLMGRAALEAVHARFTPAVAAARLEKWYFELIGTSEKENRTA